MLDQLDRLPPGESLDIAQMSPAANYAHMLLCIQQGKDDGIQEWHNHGRNRISTYKKPTKYNFINVTFGEGNYQKVDYERDGNDTGVVEWKFVEVTFGEDD